MATTKKPLDLDALTAEDVAKMKPAEQAAVKNSLLGRASTILKSKHPDEYEAIATELFSNLGLERVRRLTPEERDRAELEKLANKLGVTITE